MLTMNPPCLSACPSKGLSLIRLSVCLSHQLSICTKCHSVITFLLTFALTAISPHDITSGYVDTHAIIQLSTCKIIPIELF